MDWISTIVLFRLVCLISGHIERCQVGRYGPLCQYVCNGNCLHQECNQTTGKCNRCHERFGFDCSLPCSDKCHERQCVQDSGKCNSCKTGYYGFNCTKQCSGCLNGSCYQDTGVCQHQSRCRQGFYGTRGSEVMCNHRCNRNCKTCDKSNGTCKECDDGFYGQSCENSCQSHCINNLCIKENGSCKNGCQKTFYGDQCNNNCSESCKIQDCFRNGTCRDCVPGTYGNLCEQKCAKGCMNGNCSHNGSCIGACFNGYYGEACDKMCSDNCSAKGCDKYISYCHECKIGWYGLHCSEQCPFNCSSNTCNKTTGTCTNCVKGYHGLYCNETCSNGCKDAICDPVSGNCSHGCADGFLGQFCQKLVEGDTNTVLVMSVSAVIISTIIIVFVARMVAFVYKRKKSRTSRERSMKLNVLVDKTSEVSNLKNALAETTNGKRNKKCATPGGAKIDIYEKLISIGQHEVALSVENKSTNATVSACYEKLTDAVYSDIEFYGIIVENFEREIMQKKIENLFDLEYKKFQHDAVFPCTIAALPENRLLNRYQNTIPYDHSRVVLEEAFGPDYINASYIDGVTEYKSYIATQGPKKNTIADFWRMVWQVNSRTIVMLTNLVENMKIKCEQYWPDSSQSIQTGPLTITLTQETKFAFYISRTFEVMDKHTTECRKIEQLHFTYWPHHSVPDQTALVIFHRRFLLKENIQHGPPIVQCSAGIGQTGTFIALNALYLHGLKTGKVDVFNYVISMRNNRMNMIQTKEQYIFLHDALAEQFKYDKTAISTYLFMNFWKKEKNLSFEKRKTTEEFKMLQCGKPKYYPEEFQSGHKKENKNKNRNENILPVEKYRVCLMSVNSSSSNYINAVMLQSVTKCNGYIATQYPLQTTVSDFWCMIYDQESDVIVALNGQDIDGTTWYPNTNSDLNCGRFALKETTPETSTKLNKVQETRIKLTNKEAKEERVVNLLEFMCWPCYASISTSKSCFLLLLKEIERLHSNGPITIVCQDGASCCGVFCALSNILQSQMLYEEINIFTTISQLQKRRPEFINSYEQYQFCHEIIEESLDTTSVYCNV